MFLFPIAISDGDHIQALPLLVEGRILQSMGQIPLTTMMDQVFQLPPNMVLTYAIRHHPSVKTEDNQIFLQPALVHILIFLAILYETRSVVHHNPLNKQTLDRK